MNIKPELQPEYDKYKETNSKDAYSNRIVTYGEDWANLMEAQIALGRTVPECAKETASTADTDGITGYMYGAAVSALVHFWVHGEELRRWHNVDTQIGTEGDQANETGGVLNPAILVIQ